MYTIAETPTFVADADKLWTEEERLGFFVWLAGNPEAGDVIPDSGGCRKVRWSRAGTGKRGGVRVIYFTRLPSGKNLVTARVPEVDERQHSRSSTQGSSKGNRKWLAAPLPKSASLRAKPSA